MSNELTSLNNFYLYVINSKTGVKIAQTRMKQMNYFIKSFVLISVTLISLACTQELKKAKTEILFDQLENHWVAPTDSSKDSLTIALENYDLSDLDSSYQKAFWYNAYNFLLEESSHNKSGYLDLNDFLSKNITVANTTMSTAELIETIKSFNDPRPLICLDFYTTTSSPTYHHTLKKNGDEDLDSLCSKIINDPAFIRVKTGTEHLFYPEHFDWHIHHLDSTKTSKEMILKFHNNATEIENYEFKPYPFSYKLRN